MLMQMGPLNLHNADLKLTAGAPAQLLKSGRPQIAFSGRSNVGKSSLVNCLLGRKKLARVSGEPGKTITVNYYDIDGRLFFVDLPGYGYAKRSFADKKRWSALTQSYFEDNPSLEAVLQLIDIRTGVTADDADMARMAAALRGAAPARSPPSAISWGRPRSTKPPRSSSARRRSHPAPPACCFPR